MSIIDIDKKILRLDSRQDGTNRFTKNVRKPATTSTMKQKITRRRRKTKNLCMTSNPKSFVRLHAIQRNKLATRNFLLQRRRIGNQATAMIR